MTRSIAPIINALNRPYWSAAEDDVLMLPHCATSGRAFWPASPVSPYDFESDIEWRPVQKRGLLKSMAIYERSFLKTFEAFLPYGVGLVEIGDTVRLHAFIADPLEPGAPGPGATVVLGFRRLLPDHVPLICIVGNGNDDGR